MWFGMCDVRRDGGMVGNELYGGKEVWVEDSLPGNRKGTAYSRFVFGVFGRNNIRSRISRVLRDRRAFFLPFYQFFRKVYLRDYNPPLPCPWVWLSSHASSWGPCLALVATAIGMHQHTITAYYRQSQGPSHVHSAVNAPLLACDRTRPGCPVDRAHAGCNLG
jgi:hypothetical protein